MHEAKLVHRDIKPGNIFIGKDGSFVLGDAGLVFFDDRDKSRLSGTFENVGTRDYMPGWAHSQRVISDFNANLCESSGLDLRHSLDPFIADEKG